MSGNSAGLQRFTEECTASFPETWSAETRKRFGSLNIVFLLQALIFEDFSELNPTYVSAPPRLFNAVYAEYKEVKKKNHGFVLVFDASSRPWRRIWQRSPARSAGAPNCCFWTDSAASLATRCSFW